MKNLFLFSLLFVATMCWSQNQVPEISNLEVVLNGDETMTIYYDVLDVEESEVNISLRVSDNGGLSFQIDTEGATGDVGAAVAVGAGKSITWNYEGLLSQSGDHIIKIVANDLYELNIQEIVDQVDSNQLKNNLTFIEGVRHRNANPVHLQAVKDSIENRMSDHELGIEIQEFTFQNYTGQNIIGTDIGTEEDGQVYIVDGHYDGVFNSPGADDNGTAVSGFLEVMRILAPYNFRKTIKYIGFDLEEEGLLGSSDYVSNGIHEYETIAGVLNFEMIGYYSEEPNTQTVPAGFDLIFPDAIAQIEADDFKGNFITNVALAGQGLLYQDFIDAAANYVPDLKVVTLPTAILLPDLMRSDHAPFWLNNLEALMLTDGANFRNPNYHTPNDVFGTIDFNFMTNVVKAAVGTLCEIAEIQHSAFAETSINIMVSSTQELESCKINLAPNPGTDVLWIRTPGCFENFISMRVIDLNGKILMESKESVWGNQNIEVDISDWRSGLYFVEVYSKERIISTEKFVKL